MTSRIKRKPLTKEEKLIKGLTSPSPHDFVVKELENKGRCVFLASKVIKAGEFVMEYEGDCITRKEAVIRESVYSKNNEGCFIVNFTFKDEQFAMDGTRKFDSYSRLMNHCKKPNVKLHPVLTDFAHGKPRLAAVAVKDIAKGDEITMDYGIRRKSMTWLQCTKGASLKSPELLQADMPLSPVKSTPTPVAAPAATASRKELPSEYRMFLQHIFRDLVFTTGELTEEIVMGRYKEKEWFLKAVLKEGYSINQIRKVLYDFGRK